MNFSSKTIKSSIGKGIDNLSIPKKLILVSITFFLIIFIILIVSFLGMSILSDVRAYVNGEGLWSKAQKDAVYRLTRYLIYEDIKDYNSYLEYIKTPLGDRKARLELEKETPNMLTVTQGFMEGRNHPDDIEGMASLFRRYTFVSFISEAILDWQKGDRLFTDLTELGDQIGREIKHGTMTPTKRGTYLMKINDVNDQLTPIEDRFSFTLGQGARWIKKILLQTMVVVTLLLVMLGLTSAVWIFRRLITNIHTLQEAAHRIARGEFTHEIGVVSKDEIGDLASSFEKMKSQRQKVEEELGKKVEERTLDLKSLMEELQQFAFIASHDLREPLRKIRAFGDLLRQEGGALNETGKFYLDRMQDASKRMEDLIFSLRTYSMIDREEEPFAPVDLNEVFKDVISDLELRIKETSARIEIETMPKIWGSRVQISQLIQNLLSNALKFHAPGRAPDIKVHQKPANGESVEISVEDNGIGFEDRFADQIFKPFQRLNPRNQYEGIGMGLAICYKIVQRHNGNLTAKSRLGEGTTFFLSLPRSHN